MQSGAHGYYDTLGIPRTASSDDIRKAHRELARRYHPDLNPGDKFAEARFRDVQEANPTFAARAGFHLKSPVNAPQVLAHQ